MSNMHIGAELTDAHFDKISALVKRKCGINLHQGKKQLVKARLNKRLRSLNLRSFGEYLDLLEHDRSGNELVTMLDSISTNLTSFFREGAHFEFLKQEALPEVLSKTGQRRLRLWSAGCSSGEEPYTLAITLREALPASSSWDVRILATDLSTVVLQRAAQGLYDAERIKTVSPALVRTYFDQVKMKDATRATYQVKESIRRMITFARLNLMESWPMKGPFDIIFCRNVMIYFEKPVQEVLVNRYYNLLGPGGYLFLGHSESLTGTKHPFKYVKPTVYRRM
jgi:chemotaxis protein methyltransferase CheR